MDVDLHGAVQIDVLCLQSKQFAYLLQLFASLQVHGPSKSP